MSKRKVMSIICLALILLFIICLFVPFASDGDYSISFWEMMEQQDQMNTNIIVLIEIMLAAVIFILQICGVLKDAKFAYFSLGYLLTNYINVFLTLVNKDDFAKYLSFGFWFGIIILIATLVLLIIGNFLSNDGKPKYGYGSQPIGYDPQTGKPIYETPKTIVGYDPQTGVPIYK